MNWRRGLNRLFLVAAATWFVLAAWVTAASRASAQRLAGANLRTLAEKYSTPLTSGGPTYLDDKGTPIREPQYQDPKRVNVPIIGIVNFPPEMDDSEIEAVLNRHFKRGQPDTKNRVQIEVEARDFFASVLSARANAREADATVLRQLIVAFRPSNLRYTSMLLVLPPLVLYLAVAAIVIIAQWVFHGFRNQAQ